MQDVGQQAICTPAHSQECSEDAGYTRSWTVSELDIQRVRFESPLKDFKVLHNFQALPNQPNQAHTYSSFSGVYLHVVQGWHCNFCMDIANYLQDQAVVDSSHCCMTCARYSRSFTSIVAGSVVVTVGNEEFLASVRESSHSTLV